MRVLIINGMLDAGLKQDLAWELRRCLRLEGREVELHFRDPLSPRRPDDSQYFSHLLISGSEASNTMDQPWDANLAGLLDGFLAAGRPVLGICYGHQFIAAHLLGKAHVRKRERRVWGWLKIAFQANPLFQGVAEQNCVLCNSDEVFGLDQRFRVLAGSGHCGVLAYQLEGRPVWGVQFHPEYGPERGERVLRASVAGAEGIFEMRDQAGDGQAAKGCEAIFRNFLRAGA